MLAWRQDITFRRITGDGTALTPPPVGAGQAWPQLWLRMVYPCADPLALEEPLLNASIEEIVTAVGDEPETPMAEHQPCFAL